MVASRVDGIPEIINSEEVGLLIEPNDDRALELALRHLLSDANLRALLGKRLQLRVIEGFTWQRAWAKVSGRLKGYLTHYLKRSDGDLGTH